MRHVAVLVLGDVGRSPRMQYHCMSLASMPDTQVSLIGFQGEACAPVVENNPNIKRYNVAQPFAKANRKFFLLYAPFKVLFQIFSILWTLLWLIPRPSAVLVQNPPSIPTLSCVWLACRLRGAKFVIDWHNFGYTILTLSRGGSPLTRIAKAYEKFFGKRADFNFCVTNAMQQWLHDNWRITAIVLHDKAPEMFHECTVDEKHELFTKLKASFPYAGSLPAHSTLFTRKQGRSSAVMRLDRPALLISSTSWTPDEDFGLLYAALVEYDQRAQAGVHPSVVVVVTGKGPQRAMYESIFKSTPLSKVVILTMWLEAADYPLLLGSSDLGVCLHTSSSGLDLPMKVVDMFGTNLPVCAVGFKCLDELVKDGVNGLVFHSSHQLAEQLLQLLAQFPDNQRLAQLRVGVRTHKGDGWVENWDANARQVFAT